MKTEKPTIEQIRAVLEMERTYVMSAARPLTEQELAVWISKNWDFYSAKRS